MRWCLLGLLLLASSCTCQLPRRSLFAQTNPKSASFDVIEGGLTASSGPQDILYDFFKARSDLYFELRIPEDCSGAECFGTQDVSLEISSTNNSVVEGVVVYPPTGHLTLYEAMVDVVIGFDCKETSPITELILSVTVHDSVGSPPAEWANVEVSLGKVCIAGNPRGGFHVGYWPLFSDTELRDPPTDITADHGVTLAKWSPFLPSKDRHIIGQEKGTEYFPAWVEPLDGREPSQSFRVDLEIDESVVSASYFWAPPGPGEHRAVELIDGKVANNLVLSISCIEVSDHEIPITINLYDLIDDVGSNPDYGSFAFYFYKECYQAPPTTTAPPTGGGGMGFFGVFFIILLCLLAVFCIGGSVYKYQTKGERGVEVIPGIDTYRGVIGTVRHQCCGTPGNHVDQLDDYDTPDGHTDPAGTYSMDSYQDDTL